MAVDLVEETAAETAALIAADGGRALSGRMDVTRAAEIEAGVQRTVDELGGVDVVVNNAGITIVGAAHDLDEDDWDKELAINLKSVYLVSKAVWPRTEGARRRLDRVDGVDRRACGRSPTTPRTARRRRPSSCSRSAWRSTARRTASASTASARASSRRP